MTLEDLLQDLLRLSPEEREEKLVIFDYDGGKNGIYHNEVNACFDGEPPFHLTIN